MYEEVYKEQHKCPELIPEAVYGLTEIRREHVADTRLVANPGCYPVGVILACAPLFTSNMVEPRDVIVDSYSGISGAGKRVGDETYLFVERDENITPYNVLTHRHTPEMEQELSILAGEDVVATFVPHLVPLIRGMMTSVFLRPKGISGLTLAKLRDLYESSYADEPFIRIMKENEAPSISNVVGTNFCDIALFYDERQDRIVVLSAIDNLVKGAAGQAIQNMNVMFGLKETAGLIKTNGMSRVPNSVARWSEKPIIVS